MEDITIAHFASQGAVPSEEVLEQIGQVDILLIQVFVNPNYNKLLPTDLPAIVDKLQPKIIIPEHGQSDSDVIIANKLKITSEEEPSGELIITRSMLDEMKETKVINLDTATTR
jgi:L-ascorbate metabolism protein UlaG (beta-lactamase superfamily)